MKMHEDPPAVISHASHPGHMLRLVTTTGGPPFRCDGCKEPGSGTGRRYRCGDGCDFDLHMSCALAEATLRHRLLGDLEFRLVPEAAAACAACGIGAAGLVYRCSDSKKDLYLHPCCAALKEETILDGVHRVQLCAEAKLRCSACGEKKERGHHIFSSSRKLWAYRWCYDGEEGYLHVACMKKIAAQSWEQACGLDGGAVLEASVPIMKGLLRRRRTPGEPGSEGLEELASHGIELTNSIVEAVSSAGPSSS